MTELKRFMDSEGTLRFKAISLSDLHLFIHSEDRKNMRGVLDFLYHTESEYLFLDGDIFDIWKRMKGKHKPFTEVEARIWDAINEKAMNGTKVILLEGNHEADHWNNQEGFFIDKLQNRSAFQHIEMARSFDFVDPAGRKMLITHGDQFDPPLARRLYKLGDLGYRLVNKLDKRNPFLHLAPLHMRRKFSIAARCKDWTKNVYIKQFEDAAIGGLPDDYDGVILGHIHKVNLKEVPHPKTGKPVLYINDGDGTESVSAAMCSEDGQWMTTHWFEDRRQFDFGKLPTVKQQAPERYQQYRPWTEAQVQTILDEFPAIDYEERLRKFEQHIAPQMDEMRLAFASALSQNDRAQIEREIEEFLHEKRVKAGLNPINITKGSPPRQVAPALEYPAVQRRGSKKRPREEAGLFVA